MKILKEIRTHLGQPIPHEYYKTDSGEAMMRVWGTVIKEGAQIKCQGQWVLFDKDNKVIDLDMSRNDLADRNGFEFEIIK